MTILLLCLLSTCVGALAYRIHPVAHPDALGLHYLLSVFPFRQFPASYPLMGTHRTTLPMQAKFWGTSPFMAHVCLL